MNTESDILIIGGGIVGLALAVELKLRGAAVTVLSRDFRQAATHAAAGMLAPQAENISSAPMLELCQRSCSLYPDWVSKLEQITGKPCGYWTNGILAPVYQEDVGHKPSSLPLPHAVRNWLDRETIHLYQSGLSSEVVGGWWYPEDAQVDNRALVQVLRIAAQELSVNLKEGVTAEAFLQQKRQVSCVRTAVGDFRAQHYVLATGAWSTELLPVPVRPKKGQMLSVQVPSPYPGGTLEGLPLQRVLFGSEIYIVPRRDGSILIGATVEDVGFTPYNTPAGIQTLLAQAIRLYPDLQHFPIQEFWWGFRPATPDELPILGPSLCENLTFATGHYRNGILLAPATAVLLADLIWNQKANPLLEHFHYSRFHGKAGEALSPLNPQGTEALPLLPTPQPRQAQLKP